MDAVNARAFRVRLDRRTAGTAAVLGVLLVLASTTNAFGAARGSSYTPCLAGTSGASVHFESAMTADPANPAVSSVVIGGLSQSDCDGSSVVAVMKGNLAGDPHAKPTEVLATYNSKLDPCSQKSLGSPPVVSGGSITLIGCATGGIAGYTNVHDVTRMLLTIDGAALPVAVLGETFTKSGTTPVLAAKGPSVLATSVQLPFTGSWAALTFWIGVLLLCGGLLLFILARRRREPQDPAALT